MVSNTPPVCEIRLLPTPVCWPPILRVVESPLMGGVRLGLIPPANHTFCTVNKEVVMYGHAGVLLASIPLAVLGAATVAKAACVECGALVGHWRPCSQASPELQQRWHGHLATTECRCGRHHVCAKCLAEKAK